MLGNLCLEAGPEPDPAITSLLYSGYALEDWCSARKFGPNYVKFRTPMTNIRITTFVCNESEVIQVPYSAGILSVIGGKCVMKPPSLSPLLVSQRLRVRHRRQRLSGKSLPDEPG